jgi:hypothetical protein
MERERFMAFTVRVEQTTMPVMVLDWSPLGRVRVDAVKLVGLMRFRVETVRVEATVSVLKKAAEVCWVEKVKVERKSEPLPVKVETAVT